MNQPSYLRPALLLLCSVLICACADNAANVAAMAPDPAKPAESHAYLIVAQGQTLDKIAHTYRVPKRELIALNHLAAPYTLKPGTMLEIPLAAAKTKEPPKDTAAADAGPAPLRTAGVAAPAKHPKPRPSEPEVIPLD